MCLTNINFSCHYPGVSDRRPAVHGHRRASSRRPRPLLQPRPVGRGARRLGQYIYVLLKLIQILSSK